MLSKEISNVLQPLYKFRLLVVCVSGIYILIGLLPPYFMGLLIDNLYQFPSASIYYLIGTIAAVLILCFFLDWLQDYLWADMVNRGAGIVRSFLFAHVLHKEYSFFLKHSSGELDSKVINDAYLYAHGKLALMPTLVLNLLHIVIIFVILFVLNVYMSLMTIALTVLLFALYRYVNKHLRERAARERESFSQLMSEANESLGGIHTIQLHNVEEFFAERFEESVERYEALLTKLKFWQALSKAATNTINNVIPVAAILAGVIFLIGGGDISIAGIIAFYYFLPRLKDPIKALTDFNIDMQNAKAVEEKLEELLATEEQEGPKRACVERIDELELRDMGYRFPDGEAILKQLNVRLRRGDILAVTGPSGAGKSTLLQLLKKRLRPTEGDFLINGQSHTHIDPESYLKRIAVLTQEVFVFDSTLHDNIRFGKDLPEKVIREAARLGGIDHFSLDEDALGLSGGELARLGLARALACEYDILILDEPTASLDFETECMIIENLKEVQRNTNCIMIVITHSKNALENLCTQELKLT